jgi:hypothetical protein
MAQIEIPEDLILPEPRDDRERQIFNALQDAHRQLSIALRTIAEII